MTTPTPGRSGRLGASTAPATGEDFAVLATLGGVRIEEITSSATPDTGVQRQDHDEWVALLAGRAEVEIDGAIRILGAGEWILLPARTPHRVLRTPLIDKLELVIDELRLMGVPVNRMKVMSGFRTPQYNAKGVGSGRVDNSRHQYGDAADVYIINGSKDWMSDLNGDGKVNTKDAQVLATAAERVEQKYPDLVGGIGIYKATSAHGPFVHIDVRGNRARWSSL